MKQERDAALLEAKSYTASAESNMREVEAAKLEVRRGY
jgi:hypothetical protein